MTAPKMDLQTWRRRAKEWHEITREPGLTALVIVEASLIFLVIPLSGMGALPDFVLPAMFIVLVLAILAVTWHSHVAAAAVLIATALSPVGTLVWREDPTRLTEWVSAGGRFLAIATVSLVIARVVFGAGRVTFHRVQGAVVLYLNFGLMFFIVYRLMDDLVPNSFSGLPPLGKDFGSGAALLYFSFSTLTTLGYGDILPVHPLARNIANLEAIIGQLYPATLLARLVSLEIAHRRDFKGD
jgi:diacylglycerol kinase